MRFRLARGGPEANDFHTLPGIIDNINNPIGSASQLEQFRAIWLTGLVKKRKCVWAIGYNHFEIMFQRPKVDARNGIACLSLQMAGEPADIIARTRRPNYLVRHTGN